MATRRAGRPPGPPSQQGREAILAAARELLGELGIARVTLREVAERAGVQPPLVNYYFGSKNELFEAIIEEVALGLRDRLEKIVDVEGTPEQRFRAFLSEMIHGLAEHPFTPQLMAEFVIFPDDERTDRFAREFGGPNIAALTRVLTEGIEQGRFRQVDPRFLVPAVLGTCVFYFLGAPGLRRLLDFEPLDPENVDRYADYAGNLLLNGLSLRGDGDA
jgi:AcrR family transcriptional regulator